MSDISVSVFATFRPKVGLEGALLDALQPMLEATRDESGNETYDLYASVEDDYRSYHLFERYSSVEALEEHRSAAYYADYRAKLSAILAEPVDVIVLSEVDVAAR